MQFLRTFDCLLGFMSLRVPFYTYNTGICNIKGYIINAYEGSLGKILDVLDLR